MAAQRKGSVAADLEAARHVAEQSIASIAESIATLSELVIDNEDDETACEAISECARRLRDYWKALAPLVESMRVELELASAEEPVVAVWEVREPSAHQAVLTTLIYLMTNVIGVAPPFSERLLDRFQRRLPERWRRVCMDVLRLGVFPEQDLLALVRKESVRTLKSRLRGGSTPKVAGSVNARVAAFLLDQPNAGLREIRDGTGIPISSIQRTSAWKHVRQQRWKRPKKRTNRVDDRDPADP